VAVQQPQHGRAGPAQRERGHRDDHAGDAEAAGPAAGRDQRGGRQRQPTQAELEPRRRAAAPGRVCAADGDERERTERDQHRARVPDQAVVAEHDPGAGRDVGQPEQQRRHHQHGDRRRQRQRGQHQRDHHAACAAQGRRCAGQRRQHHRRDFR
jgi:hypothetical protein